jgi:hypothetical protein
MEKSRGKEVSPVGPVTESSSSGEVAAAWNPDSTSARSLRTRRSRPPLGLDLSYTRQEIRETEKGEPLNGEPQMPAAMENRVPVKRKRPMRPIP